MKRRLLAVSALLSCLACSGAPRPTNSSTDLDLRVPDLDRRALLLLLVDRQVFDPLAADQALRGGADLREELAVTLGRIPDKRGRPVLTGLLLDSEVTVRRAAIFSLGMLGDAEARPVLFAAERDPDRETGVLAVEALARLETPVIDVAEHLLDLPDAERWQRLLPHLFRYKEAAAIPLAEHGLGLSDKTLHAEAAYALARDPLPDAAPLLARLCGDPDPVVRGWVARGIGLLGAKAGELITLRPLLDDPEPGPMIEGMRAAGLLVKAGKAAPSDWAPSLLARIHDPRPAVRVTAIEAARYWLPEPALAGALAEIAAKGEGRERGLAVLGLAVGKDARAAELAAAAAESTDPDVRARVAEAAVVLRSEALLAKLGGDPAPLVRESLLTARLDVVGPDAAEGERLARAALSDADEGVRATILDWLKDHPVVPFDVLGRAVRDALRDNTVESGLSAVQAVVARAQAQPLERGSLLELLEKLADEKRYVLRREVGTALGKLGQPVPDLGPAENGKDVEVYRQIVQRTRRPRTVEIRTAKGAIRVRLACPRAPLTCLNFLQLASQGFYDGLLFHRVVPDYVVQGGDPRGDGYGGPNYAIPDEINRLRYARGVVGMALAGPDTGSSQFFITLSPQPRLDGGYTAFGEVVGGMEVADRLTVGDRIERVVEVAEGSF